MAAGLQVFNSSGGIVLDASKRTFRLLTVRPTGTSNGSYVNAELATGTPISAVGSAQVGKKVPNLSTSGTTVSWNWTGIAVADRATDSSVMVMVY